MLRSEQNGAMKTAMDMKSRLMVPHVDSIFLCYEFWFSFKSVFLSSADAAVPAARYSGDERAHGGLGVTGWCPVAQYCHPYTARQRTHLLLHYQQPDCRPVRFCHPFACFLSFFYFHDHLHTEGFPEQQSECVSFNKNLRTWLGLEISLFQLLEVFVFPLIFCRLGRTSVP